MEGWREEGVPKKLNLPGLRLEGPSRQALGMAMECTVDITAVQGTSGKPQAQRPLSAWPARAGCLSPLTAPTGKT